MMLLVAGVVAAGWVAWVTELLDGAWAAGLLAGLGRGGWAADGWDGWWDGLAMVA